MKYQCDDGQAQIEIEADTPRDAAQEYVDRGDWGDAISTTWIHVHVWDEDEDHGWYKIRLDPEEPECADGNGHDWQSPHELVGGLRENPGVYGHGAGVVIHEACVLCGARRTTNTWAQDPETGEQGLESVAYEAP